MGRPLAVTEAAPCYATSIEHLLAELERIDLLLQDWAARLRREQPADDPFRGMAISDAEVDRLLARPAGRPHWAGRDAERPVIARATRMIEERRAESVRRGVELRLDTLSRAFALTRFDTDVLLVALGPELDSRYERLYAYLQDDIGKRRPGVELILHLLTPGLEAAVAARQRFAAGAPLLRHRLVELLEDRAQQPATLLGRFVKTDERIAAYLLGSDEPDARVAAFVSGPEAEAVPEPSPLPDAELCRLVALAAGEDRPLLYLQGPSGAGKRAVAFALAGRLGCALLLIDLEGLVEGGGEGFATTARLAAREARLRDAVPCWTGFDALASDARRSELRTFLALLADLPGPVLLTGELAWEAGNALPGAAFARVELPAPDHRRRVGLWRHALARLGLDAEEEDLAAVAGKFRLGGERIGHAAATARDLARRRDPDAATPTAADLHAAARLHTSHRLGDLARRVASGQGWDDIVLPADRLAQLREIGDRVRAPRAACYDEWGFARKLPLGKGLAALFAGPSGTGKTMAAEVHRRRARPRPLQDRPRRAWSASTSARPRRTWRRIFDEAETGDAILFFDEADALFGKRTEVKDATTATPTSRSATCCSGWRSTRAWSILATNLRQNIDDAFVRRLHFVVEFPVPGRGRPAADLGGRSGPRRRRARPDVDLDLLARQLRARRRQHPQHRARGRVPGGGRRGRRSAWPTCSGPRGASTRRWARSWRRASSRRRLATASGRVSCRNGSARRGRAGQAQAAKPSASTRGNGNPPSPTPCVRAGRSDARRGTETLARSSSCAD